MSRERVLITGAAGFLGSHLCDKFIKEGYHVIGMDNLVTGDLRNIEHLMKLEQFEFYHHDVSKFVHVPGDIKYILHFASPASPIDYLKIPIQTLKVSSLGTHNILGLARAKKARVLVASTSEVYGDPLVHPQTEDYWGNVNPVGPRGCYDEAKRFMEAITMAYHNVHHIETRIVRIFNTYGPRMRLYYPLLLGKRSVAKI
jgi:dTDP-glucose 4,6-dehydratase